MAQGLRAGPSELLAHDPFLDYRYEGINLDRARNRLRPAGSRANAVGVLIAVIILAGAAAFFGLSSANVERSPWTTPAPRPTVISVRLAPRP